ISANAPTPSASVEIPTSIVNSPQTTNSSPRKSTCEATIRTGNLESRGTYDDANFDAHGRRVRRIEAEAQARAVDDARRNGNADDVMRQKFAGAETFCARFGPGLAAAAANRARGAQLEI